MARCYGGVPGVLGIGCLAGEWLYPTYMPWGFEAWDLDYYHTAVSYDDRTLAQFERDTGIKLPVPADDPGRYGKRFDWLMANAKRRGSSGAAGRCSRWPTTCARSPQPTICPCGLRVMPSTRSLGWSAWHWSRAASAR